MNVERPEESMRKEVVANPSPPATILDESERSFAMGTHVHVAKRFDSSLSTLISIVRMETNQCKQANGYGGAFVVA